MSEGVYHRKESCNKCGGVNTVTANDTIEGTISEAITKCKECGFEDYWSYGFFESSQHMQSNCKKY